MEMVTEKLGSLCRLGKNLGPYLVIEILMPGGSLLALLLFLYRRRNLDAASVASRAVLATTRALGRLAGNDVVATLLSSPFAIFR